MKRKPQADSSLGQETQVTRTVWAMLMAGNDSELGRGVSEYDNRIRRHPSLILHYFPFSPLIVWLAFLQWWWWLR
jgi:hypothetical protein